MSSIPGKIVISSSTKVSLNDRFTKLAQAKPRLDTSAKLNVNKPGDQATLQNRRLALQMANRPSVQAALKLKNKSIKQRLGGAANESQSSNKINRVRNDKQPIEKPNVKSRIDLAARLSLNGVPLRKKSLPAGSLNTSLNGKRRSLGNRLTTNKNNVIKRVGTSGGIVKNRAKSFDGANTRKKQINSPNKNLKRFGLKGRFSRQNNKNKSKEAPVTKTKEGLDMDLESYMAKSKGHLDADLDVYMSQSNAN